MLNIIVIPSFVSSVLSSNSESSCGESDADSVIFVGEDAPL